MIRCSGVKSPYSQNKAGISLITLIITIIVIIILAAIVIFTGLNTPDRANFAKFTQEFADFQTAMTQDALNKKAEYSVAGKILTDEQIYSIIAKNGGTNPDETVEPVGTVASLGEIKPMALQGTQVYEIDGDKKVQGWKQDKKYYDQTNEKHYVTDKGEVFMLPGYKVVDGNQTKWYINSSKYYTGEPKTLEDSETVSKDYSVDVKTKLALKLDEADADKKSPWVQYNGEKYKVLYNDGNGIEIIKMEFTDNDFYYVRI